MADKVYASPELCSAELAELRLDLLALEEERTPAEQLLHIIEQYEAGREDVRTIDPIDSAPNPVEKVAEVAVQHMKFPVVIAANIINRVLNPFGR